MSATGNPAPDSDAVLRVPEAPPGPTDPETAAPTAAAGSLPARGGLLGRLPGPTLARHLLFAVVAAGVLWWITGRLSSYNDSLLGQAAYYVPAVAGLTLLTGLNGQISLGHSALMMIGAYTTVLMLNNEVAPLWVTLAAAVAVSAVSGAIIGVAAARLRGPYLAGATLALAVGLPSVTNQWSDTLGGDNGLTVAPPMPPGFLGSDFDILRWAALVAVFGSLVTLVLLANLVKSRVGRSFRAVRDDEVAASLAGLNVGRTQVLAFVVSSACAGLAGGLLVVVVNLATPSTFSLLLSLALLTAIVLGGLGSLTGAVLGSLLLVYLPKYATDHAGSLGVSDAKSAYVSYLVYGVVLVVVMLAAPRGLVGGLQQLAGLTRRLRSRPAKTPATP